MLQSGRRRSFGVVAFWMAAIGGTGLLFAQGTADIVGTVTDNTGAVVAAAKVTAKNLATGLTRSGETNAAGDYSFTFLPRCYTS